MEIEVKYKIKVPMVPNFLLLSNSEAKVAISALSENGLREIGKQWTDDLIKRANQMRKDGIV